MKGSVTLGFVRQVLISDNGIPPLSSTTRVVVAVEDINDNAPEFEQSLYKIQIPATANFDRPVFQVSPLRTYIIANNSYENDPESMENSIIGS